MTAADREAAARRQRAQTIALWRWALIEPAMDDALTSRQRGAIVRELAAREHEGPSGTLVAVSLADQLEPGTLEHTIHYVVEERLDLAGFDQERTNDDTGRPGYNPRVLLKVVLLGYARGLLSSRKLEKACQQNIIFMALTCGQCPDHSTIAGFVSAMGEERIGGLFSQVLLVCAEEGLLGGTHFAIDGYKLPSNAAKEWSGTHADLRQKHDKLRALVRQSMREHRRNDRSNREQSCQDEHSDITEIISTEERVGRDTDCNRQQCRDGPIACMHPFNPLGKEEQGGQQP